jgi:branched-chain amino acid transport system ATP-binding protein
MLIYGYILEGGHITMEGPAKALADNKDVKEFYLGMSGDGRKSFRDMKILSSPTELALV